MDHHQIDVPNNNCRLDLMSSLFGNRIAAGILNDDQNPTTNGTNYSCPHPVFIGKCCTKCGSQITDSSISTVPFWYIYPDLSLSLQEINRIRDENLQTLLSRRKLHLVLDLDHTLLHKRSTYKLSAEDRTFLRSKKHGIDHNLAEGGTLFNVSDGWIKLRPFVRNFLEEASTMYDMTIYTVGGRNAARAAAKMLDPNGQYFDNWRVIAGEDCVMLDKNKKTLDVLLEHERIVLVLDDNEAVWEDYKANYLKVTPYNYFSYFSPEDKEHDASPTRHSWSQLNTDESEEDGVLAKLLVKLRMIHAAFYDDSGVQGDVRQVLQRIQSSEKSGKKQKQQKEKKTRRPVRG